MFYRGSGEPQDESAKVLGDPEAERQKLKGPWVSVRSRTLDVGSPTACGVDRCRETYGMMLARNTVSFLSFLRNCLLPWPPKIAF